MDTVRTCVCVCVCRQVCVRVCLTDTPMFYIHTASDSWSYESWPIRVREFSRQAELHQKYLPENRRSNIKIIFYVVIKRWSLPVHHLPVVCRPTGIYNGAMTSIIISAMATSPPLFSVREPLADTIKRKLPTTTVCAQNKQVIQRSAGKYWYWTEHGTKRRHKESKLLQLSASKRKGQRNKIDVWWKFPVSFMFWGKGKHTTSWQSTKCLASKQQRIHKPTTLCTRQGHGFDLTTQMMSITQSMDMKMISTQVSWSGGCVRPGADLSSSAE